MAIESQRGEIERTNGVTRTSSRKKRLSELSRSNSGFDKLRAIAVTPDVSKPSIPAGVIKCCMFGVNLKGTGSVDR